MVDNVGPLGSIKLRNFIDRPSRTDQPIATPSPGDRAQDEAFLADLFAMCAHSSRDDDLEAGISSGPRYRQTMRAEIPILGDQKEELWPPCRVRCGRRRRHGL